ncbi:MAG TPA: N-acetylmuramoyl-L-alanine amidase, partial [Megamonas funiformis]|nr:N-acetylmuramoyl-L-alanine amidase [Megamonas funiformis]
HHSAIGGNDDITAADIHRIHLQNGWSGIGYHMFIRKSGLIETGRPLEDIGAHTYQHNNSSIGICLSGNFND